MASIAEIQPEIQIGDVISFTSKLANDLNNYHGEVIGFVTYEVAKAYDDIYTYNNNVRTIDSGVPDTDLLKFMMLKLIDPLEGSTKLTVVFAQEWILEATLVIIATEKVAVLELFDTDNSNVNEAIDLLRSGGFKSRVVELR